MNRPETSGGEASGLLGRRVLRNTAFQALGRNLIALTRLVVIIIIIRVYGQETFGSYAIMIALLQVAEGIVDFGTTEIFVREVARQPTQMKAHLRILVATKLLQIPIAFALLLGITYALTYPAELIEALLLACFSLVFFAGVLIYRVIFKATLTMERELLPEFVSAVAMIGMLFLFLEGGLFHIALCHLASRALFFFGCYWLGRETFVPSIRGVTRQDVIWGLGSSATIGAAGFLVMVYEALDVLMLSRLAPVGEVALYSGAQRMAWPLLMALAAVGGSLYPILSTQWPQRTAEFRKTCDDGLRAMLAAGGLALSAGLAGAEFLMGILGPGMIAGVDVFKLLLLLSVSKAVAMTIGPALLVIKAQRSILAMVALALIAKTFLLLTLDGSYGAMGVAWTALSVDLVFVEAPAIYLVHRYTGYLPNPMLFLQLVASTAAAVLLPGLIVAEGSLPAAILAIPIYCTLALRLKIVTLDDFRRLIRRSPS